MIIQSDNRKSVNDTSVCDELPSFVVDLVSAFAVVFIIEVVVTGFLVVVCVDGEA